jgi:hypothetical protein
MRRCFGLLGQEPTAWAECLFADPVGDIAVLGEPELIDECDAYKALVEAAVPLSISDAPRAEAVAIWQSAPPTGEQRGAVTLKRKARNRLMHADGAYRHLVEIFHLNRCAGFVCQFQNFPGSMFATSGLSRSAM